MSTYSTSFFLGFVSNGSTTLFTTSPQDVTVLRDIEVFNGAGSAQDILLTANVSGSNIVLIKWPLLAPVTHAQWEGRVVLAKNEQVTVLCGVDFVHLAVSGYQLSG